MLRASFLALLITRHNIGNINDSLYVFDSMPGQSGIIIVTYKVLLEQRRYPACRFPGFTLHILRHNIGNINDSL